MESWEASPVNASSGRTRRSISCSEAASKTTFARVTFSAVLPILGLNCRHAIRILQRKPAGTVGVCKTPSCHDPGKDCYVAETVEDKIVSCEGT